MFQYVLVVAMLVTGLAQASSSRKTGFVCNRGGAKTFHIDWGAPRYMDSWSLNTFDQETIRGLLTPKESATKIHSINIFSHLVIGSCAPGKGDVIANCQPRTKNFGDVSHVVFNFASGESEWADMITVTRRFQIHELDLQVIKVVTRSPHSDPIVTARLKLKAKVKSRAGESTIEADQSLGEFVEGEPNPFNQCGLVSDNP